MTRRRPEGAFSAHDTIPRTPPRQETTMSEPRMTLDQALFQRDGYQQAYEQCRADVAQLRTENRQLRMRLDEMDIRAGEILDSPVVDGRTSVRPEYVEALRATMQRPIDQEEMPR